MVIETKTNGRETYIGHVNEDMDRKWVITLFRSGRPPHLRYKLSILREIPEQLRHQTDPALCWGFVGSGEDFDSRRGGDDILNSI